MGTRLFLGNLPWSATDAELGSLLSERGVAHVSVKVVTDRETGRSRGYAFVELAEGADADAAKAALTGAVVGDRDLHVEDAVSAGPRSGQRRAGAPSREPKRRDMGRGRRRERGGDFGWDS